MTEEWRVVSDFPDYEVSNFGRVRSWKASKQGLDAEARILRPGVDLETPWSVQPELASLFLCPTVSRAQYLAGCL